MAPPDREPRNPFYFLLLLTGLVLVITLLAVAIIPILEQKAREAGEIPPPSPFREALHEHGLRWVLYEVAALVVFGIASMVLDRLRALQKERSGGTIAPTRPNDPSP